MRASSAGVRVRCPAKVNLHLEVIGRRPDGFHELRTLFAAVGVFDEVEAVPGRPGELVLEVEPPGAVAVADNLVLQAARAARAAWQEASGARLTLRKRIPVAGGMGGGSADAAATLVALAALWGRDGSAAALHGMAAALGSDVAFFLVGGVAWGEGRGEKLRPLPDLPPWWLLIVPGEEPVSTAEVYRRLELTSQRREPARPVYDWLAGGGELPLAACRNDLEPTVAAFWPGVARRLAALRASTSRLAMVSGSGGTVFAVCPDEEEARAEAGRLAAWRPLVAPLLGRERSVLRPTRREGR